MAVVLEHSFTTTKGIDESYETITDLERTIPCVEGGRVVERTGPDSVRAEIVVSMGAMSLSFAGTVEITEKDPDAHRVVMTVKSKEAGGPGVRQRDGRPSRSPTTAARSTPTPRSRAPPRRWGRASSPGCSTP